MFSLAVSRLADTYIDVKNHFGNEAAGYQQVYGNFKEEKTGMKLGSGMYVMRMGGDDEDVKPIDVNELPDFQYQMIPLADVVNRAALDIGLLIFFQAVFLALVFVKFYRYDVR